MVMKPTVSEALLDYTETDSSREDFQQNFSTKANTPWLLQMAVLYIFYGHIDSLAYHT